MTPVIGKGNVGFEVESLNSYIKYFSQEEFIHGIRCAL